VAKRHLDPDFVCLRQTTQVVKVVWDAAHKGGSYIQAQFNFGEATQGFQISMPSASSKAGLLEFGASLRVGVKLVTLVHAKRHSGLCYLQPAYHNVALR